MLSKSATLQLMSHHSDTVYFFRLVENCESRRKQSIQQSQATSHLLTMTDVENHNSSLNAASTEPIKTNGASRAAKMNQQTLATHQKQVRYSFC